MKMKERWMDFCRQIKCYKEPKCPEAGLGLLDHWIESDDADDPALKKYYKVYEVLKTYYSHQPRFYHTLEWHIANSLDELDSARHICEKSNQIEMALWFHDAVYDTVLDDSEEISAYLAEKVCNSMGLPKEFTAATKNLIISTANHRDPKSNDDKIIVDIDFSILGRPEKEFDRYETAVMKEYKLMAGLYSYTEKALLVGRIMFIHKMLGLPNIYHTDFFKEKYEDKARNNLKRSLERYRKEKEQRDSESQFFR